MEHERDEKKDEIDEELDWQLANDPSQPWNKRRRYSTTDLSATSIPDEMLAGKRVFRYMETLLYAKIPFPRAVLDLVLSYVNRDELGGLGWQLVGLTDEYDYWTMDSGDDSFQTEPPDATWTIPTTRPPVVYNRVCSCGHRVGEVDCFRDGLRAHPHVFNNRERSELENWYYL